MKIVFMGTPDFALGALQALAAEHEIIAVYTRAPKPSGRGMQAQKTPVHSYAEQRGIPVFTPKTLKAPEEQAFFKALGADVAVVVAYGLLLPLPILSAPKGGCFNIHASLLPRWRGAAPLQRALMAQDSVSGLTIMKMDEGLDTGPMALRAELQMHDSMTLKELHDALKIKSGPLILETLKQLEQGTLSLTPQPQEGISYAQKIEKHESFLDFSLSAQHLNAVIRAIGGYFESSQGRIKVLEAEVYPQDGQSGVCLDNQLLIGCGQGALRLTKLQRAGGKPMTGAEFQRGKGFQQGDLITAVAGHVSL